MMAETLGQDAASLLPCMLSLPSLYRAQERLPMWKIFSFSFCFAYI